MNRKTLLAIALMFLTYWVFNTYIIPKPQKNVTKPATEETKDNNNNEQVSSKDEPISNVIASGDIIQDDTTKVVTLANDFLELTFSNRNAVITSAKLKNFKLTDEQIVQLIPTNTVLGKVDLDKGKLDNYLYLFEENKNSVRFYLNDKDGNEVFSKEYVLHEDYQLDLNLAFSSEEYQDDYTFNVNGITDTENLSYKEKNPESYFKGKTRDYKFISLDNNEIESYDLNKLKKSNQNSESQSVKWAAVRSKYFVISLFSNQISGKKTYNARMENESPAFTLSIEDANFDDIQHKYNMYLGPVDPEFINKFDSTLEFDRVIERSWTWLHWLSKLFEIVFKYLGKVIPNYGLVIIIFAILMKVILYPLTHKAFENSTKMQQIQPQLNAIQKQYKSDPMKMQQERSKVMKEHGVSTLGGCLPMLIQMPIFFALYPTLRYSLGLRGASFVGWLQDLSIPDPYYVLPILMGVFMFIQQKMMLAKQKTGNQDLDEKQEAMMQSQKMMAYFMPVIMFFIFKNLPSGLVLYWTVFNILGIFQQNYINKKFRGQ